MKIVLLVLCLISLTAYCQTQEYVTFKKRFQKRSIIKGQEVYIWHSSENFKSGNWVFQSYSNEKMIVKKVLDYNYDTIHLSGYSNELDSLNKAGWKIQEFENQNIIATNKTENTIDFREINVSEIDSIREYKTFKYPKLILSAGIVYTVGTPILLRQEPDKKLWVPLSIGVGVLSVITAYILYRDVSAYTICLSEWNIIMEKVKQN